jgi:hypothetical protein
MNSGGSSREHFSSREHIQFSKAWPEGHNVDDGDVVHLSPARYAHINPYGKYRFNVEGEFHRKGLRPLRRPDSVLA